MKIAIGCDHAGVGAKEFLKKRLAARHEIMDLGANSPDSVDYPDFAAAVGHAVAEHRAERGILICGTGIGMSIAANKVHGVRAAVVHSQETAELARRHNDANVICLGARVLHQDQMAELTESFLATQFEGGRHSRRVAKIAEMDK